MCTALAVIGGRYVSTKISVKHGALNVTSSPAVADVFPQ
jgi:putative Ca2+/H+ antiporter (TMEM165/GDT1 family)